MENTNQIMFDPDNLDGMRQIMDNYANHDTMMFGTNDRGEQTQMSVNTDSITITTNQKNGYVRTNIYHRNGDCEELYDSTV